MKLSEFRQKREAEKKLQSTPQSSTMVSNLELILDVIKNINSSLILDDVLELVLTHAIKISESERGFIVLKNENDQLEYRMGLDYRGTRLPEHFFNVSTTVVEDVYRSGVSKFIEGAQSDSHFQPTKSILKLALQTILCSPLTFDDKKIGVIYLDSKFLNKINNVEIIKMFEILAGQAAIAIRNAQYYEALSDSKKKVEASDKLKTAFLSQMSHEIRTPINIILNYNTLIKEEFYAKIDERVHFIFDGIENSGNRLIRTLDNILNMSSIQSGNFEIVFSDMYLKKLLLDIKEDFQNAAFSKNVNLKITDNSTDPVVKGDEYTLAQIFQNLVDNAIKYTPQGEVEILIFNNDESKLCVAIKDTGIGISETYLPRLFDLFSQEESGYSRRFDGSGLGLSLVKRYADLNNCEVLVESEKGKGSTFTIVFK